MRYIFAILLAAALHAGAFARERTEFDQFLRTRDSLMHIAFYDKDLPAYKKNFKEVLAKYQQQDAGTKKKYKNYISDEYYFQARAYALAGDKKNALASLLASEDSDYADLKDEPDLDNLKADPKFIKYLEVARNKPSHYVAILQKEAKYNRGEKQGLPEFRYQPETDTHLMALKKKYRLDSVAGEGEDITKIINLMKWVHYLIPHDGSKPNPATKNAMSMIKECTRDKKTLNCRGLAIILNEVYLAEGFKSRFVTCLPKDTADQDCHVINIVWCPSRQKWLWIDPTFMAYVMDEQGDLLSIEEVRERLIDNKPLVLNPDANRYHGNTQTKADYLESYMAKNLYRLECPVSSEYNYETNEKDKVRKYIQLRPGTAAPTPLVKTDEHGVTSFAVYYTNNPAAFWSGEGLPKKTRPGSEFTQADYEGTMAKYMDAYNNNNLNGIIGLMEDQSRSWWKQEMLDRTKETYGALKSFTYMGMELDNKYEDDALFMVVYEKSVHCMAISLMKGKKIGTYRGLTYSNYIDWRLAKEMDKLRASAK